ncbi:MAG: sigma-70 family RNA polymerase sigma factor [Chitinophagaceae bacterium]|nr:sigma-70 family RNA polymerase sigma factor [Chitinophagaceae bacterium]
MQQVELANDESALETFRKGDETGFAFLFRVYYPVLVVFACKFTSSTLAEEIVNESFYKIWVKRSSINSLSHFRSYLYKIVYHDCLKAKHEANPATIPENFADDFDYSSELIRSETLRQLYHAIDNLPAQCKTIVTELYVNGKTVREIADAMGLAVSTVKAQKARGILLLKEKLGNVDPSVLLLATLFS